MKNRFGHKRTGPGFYWIRFEGAVIVAEWRDRRWWVGGAEFGYTDRMVCEILSDRLEAPR